VFRLRNARTLAAVDDAQAAAPGLRDADANDFHLRTESRQQHIGGGVEPQLRRDEVDERARLSQFDAGEVTVAREIALLQVTPDTQPVVRRLQGEGIRRLLIPELQGVHGA
jgi:hypothetical protein